MGLEDLETMERLFSASNALAPVIRYCSPFRRHQFIDLFLMQWDEDKYLALGLMLRNNYQQALTIITEQTPLLDEILVGLKASREDLDRWQGEQTVHFATTGKEPQEDLHRIAYVGLLQDLRDAV